MPISGVRAIQAAALISSLADPEVVRLSPREDTMSWAFALVPHKFVLGPGARGPASRFLINWIESSYSAAGDFLEYLSGTYIH